ncbi:nitroreductase family protein [Paenibacillus humicola]|uniref:nitroreductase family protein n=1 Tax=Paenibacillus humicola TaxID=3110540 RepID=UPI00237BCA6E|nr:nitroreductase family protein [Paenibacillus humicola]
MIGITDPDLRKKLAARANGAAVGGNGYLFIFCADLYRIMAAASPEDKAKMRANLSSSFFFQTAVLSAALALQNANLAAESMGLGTVIIGAVNSALPELDEWLNLSEFVIPMAGFAVGVPDEQPEQKPRLPQSVVFFENRYDPDMKESIAQYDRDMELYYEQRTDNKQKANWSQKFIGMLTADLPLGFYTEYIRRKGFALK